jgi:hypothetical protein
MVFLIRGMPATHELLWLFFSKHSRNGVIPFNVFRELIHGLKIDYFVLYVNDKGVTSIPFITVMQTVERLVGVSQFVERR